MGASEGSSGSQPITSDAHNAEARKRRFLDLMKVHNDHFQEVHSSATGLRLPIEAMSLREQITSSDQNIGEIPGGVITHNQWLAATQDILTYHQSKHIVDGDPNLIAEIRGDIVYLEKLIKLNALKNQVASVQQKSQALTDALTMQQEAKPEQITPSTPPIFLGVPGKDGTYDYDDDGEVMASLEKMLGDLEASLQAYSTEHAALQNQALQLMDKIQQMPDNERNNPRNQALLTYLKQEAPPLPISSAPTENYNPTEDKLPEPTENEASDLQASQADNVRKERPQTSVGSHTAPDTTEDDKRNHSHNSKSDGKLKSGTKTSYHQSLTRGVGLTSGILGASALYGLITLVPWEDILHHTDMSPHQVLLCAAVLTLVALAAISSIVCYQRVNQELEPEKPQNGK